MGNMWIRPWAIFAQYVDRAFGKLIDVFAEKLTFFVNKSEPLWLP